MKAVWLVPGEVEKAASRENPGQALLGYGMASVRMRSAVAALAWTQGGHESVFVNPDAAADGRFTDWSAVAVAVLPKFYFDVPPDPWYQACVSAKQAGCALVIDICDYPFAKSPQVQTFYSRVLNICDAVVVNSERMGELMAPHVLQPPVVIDDAILGTARNPEFAPAGRLRLLWFGHRINLQYLDAWLESLVRFAREMPCRLTVMTEGGVGVEQAMQQVEARFGPAVEARFVQWSLEAMAGAMRRTDLVLIPSDPSDSLKAGVSANRIAETLSAGRLAIASPMPSYQAFADSAWLGQDVVAGIRWALANRIEVRARIRRGQELLAQRYAADRVGARWLELFEKLRSFSSS